MLDLSTLTAPVEWVVTHSAAKEPIALVRRLRLGPNRDLYFRAVTWRRDVTKRELVGYWSSLEEAVQNVYGLYERSLPPQFLMTGGGTTRQPAPLTKPKPPPASTNPEVPAPHPLASRNGKGGERRMPSPSAGQAPRLPPGSGPVPPGSRPLQSESRSSVPVSRPLPPGSRPSPPARQLAMAGR